MKKSIIAMLALAMCATVAAQNEHMYIFRNNRSFDFFRLSDISEITYSGTGGKYSTMAVKTATEEKRITMQQIDSCVVRSTAIPDIYVNLTEYPDIDQLFDGNGFNKSTIYAARLRMDGNGMYDDLPEQEVEFRGRGNSTWSFKKKPYRFKMKKKASVCDLPKAKTFALIANYIDPSHMRNAVALWVARELGLPYTNHTVPVNVYLNGFYRGAYFMTEKIGIGSGSVDIDENTGMLFELDNALDEDYTFIYTFSNDRSKSLPVMVKDPDLDEIKPNPVERTAYLNDWKSDFTKMANAITSPAGKRLADYIDVEEAARYVLVYALSCNGELQHPKSMYIHKEALGAGHVYHFGPVWDFDWAFGFNGYYHGDHKGLPFAADLEYAGASFMQALVGNQEFRTVFKRVWDDFYANIYPRMFDFIENYSCMIEPSARRDGLLWPDDNIGWAMHTSSFDTAEHAAELSSWLRKRVEWCNTHPNWGLY